MGAVEQWKGFGVVFGVAALMAYGAWNGRMDKTDPKVSADILSCVPDKGGVLADVRVSNQGQRTRTIRVHLSYRDMSGTHLADSVAVAWTVRPGDMSTVTEHVRPDVRRDKWTCQVDKVDWSGGHR